MGSVAILGGGPGGYEAALVARQLGAEVTLVDRDGIGGSAVLTDCVPSKTLIAAADLTVDRAVDLALVNSRVRDLAAAQSEDIASRLTREGVQLIRGSGRLAGAGVVIADGPDGFERHFDTVLLATGARPRVLPQALPDGERILTWEQLYHLPEVPERLIVVGSGVTGAEFASAYRLLGSEVVLVSSRDRVLPGEDPDAAQVVEEVFARRGLVVLARSRAVSASRSADGVLVRLEDGRLIEGSHVLMAVGSLPNTEDLGLAEAGVHLDDHGFIQVDRVSRTSGTGVYAAGDCTGVLMLASVAAMQGRIAMWHALGDAVQPLDRNLVCSAVFTNPQIATVGLTQRDLDEGRFRGDSVLLPLATNARAKMQGQHDGFVKILCRRGSRIIAGAVIVGANASELIHGLTVAVDNKLTVDELALTFTVYPSLSGSIAEAARRLHVAQD
jgi:dihydrolipoamide dehydrogenase